ncbi:porin [Shewanella sp. NIFS-20-20]|uniref:porin n=1 Tax=Shewanella sp. NIFS-20-20 TaxID=2853806 RepID=UPI001C477746|nr:porin [Shewanella sp. NIFS-20-20]MBV7317456.1 porin [Shewanella sp. NIFS-20-20]
MMNKAILLLATLVGAGQVAAAPFHFFGVAENADAVNFRAYLSVHAMYEQSARMGVSADGSYDSGLNFDTEASMLGVNGRVKAADGLDFIYNVDYGLDFHSHASTMGVYKEGLVHRNQWLGIDTDYGQLRLGRDDAFHFYVNTIGAERFFSTLGAGKFIHKNLRYHGNVGTYLTPMLGNVKLGLQYFSPKENDGGEYYLDADGSKADMTGASTMAYFNQGDWNLAVSYDHQVEGSDGVRVGGNYTGNGMRFGFTWSQFEQRLLQKEAIMFNTHELQDLDTYAISAEYRINPKWRAYAQYGHANNGYWTSLVAHGIKRPELFGVEVDQFNIALERKFANRTFISPEFSYYKFGDVDGHGNPVNFDDEIFAGIRFNLILM